MQTIVNGFNIFLYNTALKYFDVSNHLQYI